MARPIKIVAVIPAFNESARVQEVIKEVKKYVDKIIVVDDGSIDDTFKKSLSSKTIVVRHILNLGQGAALQTGFELAKKINADIVVTFDADGQFVPSEIPKIINPIIKYKVDIALGSRFLGDTVNIPKNKFLVLKLGIIFTRIFSGIKLSDTHNGFRALNKKALYSINITQNKMSHASEIIDQIKLEKLRFVEVPVTVKYDHYSRNKGQSIFNAFNIVGQLLFNKIA